MATDLSRLFTLLQNTGLQTKDNPTYQVIHSLITAVRDSIKEINTNISNTPTSKTTTVPPIVMLIDDNTGTEPISIGPISPSLFGFGTPNKLVKWATSNTLTDSLITESTAVVGGITGSLATGAALQITGSVATPGATVPSIIITGNISNTAGTYSTGGLLRIVATGNSSLNSKADLALFVSNTFTGSGGGAVTGQRIEVVDNTNVSNQIQGLSVYVQCDTGNSFKDIRGIDLIIGDSLVVSHDIYSIFSLLDPSGAFTAGTRRTHGIHSITQISGNNGGVDENIAGYFRADGVVTSGTITNYGIYIANGIYSIAGTSTAIGLYVEAISGADTNYAAIFAGGNVGISNTSPTNTLDITGTFRATGAAILGSTLDLTGNFNVNTNKFNIVAASGNTAIAGTLDVTGNFNINTNKFQVTASSGATSIAGTVNVTGAQIIITNASAELQVKISGGLTMTLQPGFFGTSTNDGVVILTNNAPRGKWHAGGGFSWGDTTDPGATNFRVAGTSTLVGNVTASGTLSVTGDFAVNTNKFTVTASSGNTAVAGTLGVTGDTTLSAKEFLVDTALSLTYDGVTVSNDKDPGATGITRVTGTVLTGSALLGGLTGGTNGRVQILWNTVGFPLVLVFENAGSTAANRFAGAASKTVASGAMIVISYDGTTSRWRFST